jgi:hypothetical protein
MIETWEVFFVKILHILNDGPTKLSDEIIRVQFAGHDVKVIDLSKGDMSYEDIIDEIFSRERVVSW